PNAQDVVGGLRRELDLPHGVPPRRCSLRRRNSPKHLCRRNRPTFVDTPFPLREQFLEFPRRKVPVRFALLQARQAGADDLLRRRIAAGLHSLFDEPLSIGAEGEVHRSLTSGWRDCPLRQRYPAPPARTRPSAGSP